MFNATVASTSNQKFRSEKMRDMKSDIRNSESDGEWGERGMRGGGRVNISQLQQTSGEEEEHKSCYKKYKTPLYLSVVITIIIFTIVCIFYVALGGLQ